MFGNYANINAPHLERCNRRSLMVVEIHDEFQDNDSLRNRICEASKRFRHEELMMLLNLINESCSAEQIFELKFAYSDINFISAFFGRATAALDILVRFQYVDSMRDKIREASKRFRHEELMMQVNPNFSGRRAERIRVES